MGYGIVKLEQMALGKKSINEMLKERKVESIDVIEIKILGMRGNVISLFKKDAKIKKAINKLLGTDFKSVLRDEKNRSESFNDKSIALDGDMLILKKDGDWIQIGCTEWGSIHTK